jgi:serine/threonine-protein kinase
MQGRVFMGRYETIRQIGEGGMGRVYLARQIDLGRQVVVKVMHDHIAADPKFRERFTRETLLMARFQHPYAVTLYDASLNDPQGPCIVMEYIRGVTLDALLLANSRLNPARVGRLLYMFCEVLHAAHTVGIIHRDLKPANLMIVDPDTPYEVLKVMDFGLAKPLGADVVQKVTVTNTEFAVGTPGYMCPEQARGEEMDNRGDLYSVGIILYEVLTGQLPFSGRSTMDVLLAQATEDPPPFSLVARDHGVPETVEQVVQMCLAKSPADRPRNARELNELYEAALRGESPFARFGAPSRPTRLMGAAGSRTRATPGRREAPGREDTGPLPGPLEGPDGVGLARQPRVGGPDEEVWPPEHEAKATEAVSEGEPGELSPAALENDPAMAAAGAPPLHPSAAAPQLHRLPINFDHPSSRAPVGTDDPLAVMHRLEAMMPEGIAACKLRGFVHDVGGEISENVPGRVRMQVGGKGSIYTFPPRSSLSWLGLGRRPVPIHCELFLEHVGEGRDSELLITVVFRAATRDQATDIAWRNLCTQIFCDLRAYLMGQTGAK